MPYPEDPLGVRISAAPGADLTADPSTYSWQDITDDWYASRSAPIRIERGGKDEQAETKSELTFTLKNGVSAISGGEGRYTSDNPESDLWPYFDLNCPIRLEVDPGDGVWHQRAVMYIAAVRPRWPGNSGQMPLVDVTAAGLLRRLQQGKDPKSALRRSHLSVAGVEPLAYWSLEQREPGTEPVTAVRSDLPDGGDLHIAAGGIRMGTVTGPVGSLAHPLVVSTNTGTSSFPFNVGTYLHGTLPTSTPGFWSMMIIVKGILANALDSTVMWRLLQVTMGDGTTVDVIMYGRVVDGVFRADTACGVDVVGLVGTVAAGVPFNPWDGDWHSVEVTQTQEAGDVVTRLYCDGTFIGSSSDAGTLSYPAEFIGVSPIIGTLETVDADNIGSAVSPGHLAFYATDSGQWVHDAMTGYPGERAPARIQRLCEEEGVNVTVTAPEDEGVRMGPQAVNGLVPLIREAERADRGILDDSQGIVAYRALAELYNQDPALTIDGHDRQLFTPFEPTRDDQKVRNDVVATRPTGGFSKRVEYDSHIAKVGRYDEQLAVNVATDKQLRHQASWRGHEGTVDGMRYPNITVDLLRAPTLISDWLAVDLGDRATIVNPPRAHAKGDVDLLLRGWTESIFGRRGGWTITCNCQRYDPYEVYEVETGSGNRSRIPAGVSTLDVTYGPTATSLSVTSATVRWIDSATYPTMFPIDIAIAGETLRVTAIAGTGLTQTFTVQRAFNGVRKTLPAGSVVQLHRAPVIAL